MSEQTNTSAPIESSTTTTSTEPAVNTQATSQADITPTETVVNPATQPSKDAVITKKEPVPEPVETPVPTEPFRPNYDGMINGYLNGELDEADYEAIEKSGLSREMFTLMGEGIKAKQEANTQQLYSYVGGKEAYEEIKEFASINLSESEIEAFNIAIGSNEPRIAQMATLGLKALREASLGTKPTDRIEADGSFESAEKFESQADYLRETRSYKYKSDKAYAAEVNAKRNRSGF